MNTQRVEGHTPKDCRFCESSDNESRFIEQKFYAPEDEHQERARYRYVYFRFCNGCGCQGPQGNSPEQALELWNRHPSIERLEKVNEALAELVNLFLDGWQVEKASLYDEEGVEGWRWTRGNDEYTEIGDWSELPTIPEQLAKEPT